MSRAAGSAGYAARFSQPAEIEGFVETVCRGAFRRSLTSGSDILALVDHDPSKLMARTRSGTLRLSEDAQGLAFDLDVPPTTIGSDVLAMAERNDLGGMSFGFRVGPGGNHWPDKRTRELREVELVEVSIIHAHPAYPNTVVQARNRFTLKQFPSPARRRRLVEFL